MQSLNMQNHNLSFIMKESKQKIIIRVIFFDSIFIKKKKPNPILKKKTKSVQTGLARFFLVWLDFSVWFSFFPVWVRFNFFSFRLIKPKPNQLVFLKF